jgi:hypothetical protein
MVSAKSLRLFLRIGGCPHPNAKRCTATGDHIRRPTVLLDNARRSQVSLSSDRVGRPAVSAVRHSHVRSSTSSTAASFGVRPSSIACVARLDTVMVGTVVGAIAIVVQRL